MPIQMYDKQGNSKIVDNQEVRQHRKMGWTLIKPKNIDMPKSKATKKTVVKTAKIQKETTNEPAESSLNILEAEATAEVIKPTKKEN